MKNIDYGATLQKFFAENIKYLEKLARKTKDKKDADRISAAIDMVRRIAANPAEFADYRVRAKEGMESAEFARAFIPVGTDDNSVYLSFSGTLHLVGDLNSRLDIKREQAQEKLLKALKTIKYKNSSNVLKDFTFPFMSQKYFAVKAENDR